MTDPIRTKLRTWREIADEASRETDHERLTALIEELGGVVLEEVKRRHPQQASPNHDKNS